MKISDFATLVAEREGGKKEISITQIKEVIRIAKDLIKEELGIDIYKDIRKID